MMVQLVASLSYSGEWRSESFSSHMTKLTDEEKKYRHRVASLAYYYRKGRAERIRKRKLTLGIKKSRIDGNDMRRK